MLENNFQCKYKLNIYCQLYSRPCSDECRYYNNCNLCKDGRKSMGCTPCSQCSNINTESK